MKPDGLCTVNVTTGNERKANLCLTSVHTLLVVCSGKGLWGNLETGGRCLLSVQERNSNHLGWICFCFLCASPGYGYFQNPKGFTSVPEWTPKAADGSDSLAEALAGYPFQAQY